MIPSAPKIPAALGAAVQRIKVAARDAAQRCVDALGVAALASTKSGERENLLAAQFEINRKQSSYAMAFNERIDESIAAEMRRLDGGSKGSSLGKSSWQSLSLVDDREVEIQVSAERIALVLQHDCEWELREVESLMLGLLRPVTHPEVEPRNPVRPEVIGKALVGACDAVVDSSDVRKVLAEQMGRALASAMPTLYGTIAEELKAAGVRPPEPNVRMTQGPGNEMAQFTNTGYDTLGRPVGIDAHDSGAGRLHSGPGRLHGGAGQGHGGAASGQGNAGSGPVGTGPAHGAGSSSAAGAMGSVDADLMSLIRRLAVIGNLAGDTVLDGGRAGHPSGPGALTAGQLPNVILSNREELRRAATGSLDHMVIDVVGSLFDQILSDPKVPPQMARHLARLQLPVLRAALGDPTFFSSRRHPVRRLVNRMASMAVAFEDFTSPAGQQFLAHVRELVEEIVNGDFDQIRVYEQTLDKLESFVAEQAKRDVESKSQASSLLDHRETELLLQQRYMQQLHAALTPVPMDDFMREFLTQVWSQAMMRAAGEQGPAGEKVQRFRAAGRELVLSVQAKSTPADRKAFLVRLPQLMKDLNEGIALIGWPEAAKKDFFGKLLPAHAASLKGGTTLRTLDYNLLSRQLDAVLATPLPQADEAVRGMSALPVLEDVVHEPFTREEAQRIGLVEESAIDWNGEVDIDLSDGDEPEVSEVDIKLEGLPAPEPIEPSKGASLADHVQIGFSYRMHFEGQWHKVRLSHISPGRTFFVFTRGKEHQHAISMTARMLYRLCETGRLRAYENAYLLERATARARKQLAALRGGTTTTSTSGVPLTRY
ncbi:MAG TPA: DUF1631 family protein [Burkholderiaceae bacterium]|nr:DUF1631 family protein [Burkholderiaceae bacterium]